MKSLRKINLVLIFIILLGIFFRTFKARDFFYYGHDQDLASWFVRDVVENGHVRLIGQETSTAGIFIGPLYYYLLVPFYVLYDMDPLGGVALVTALGVFTILSIYFVFSKIFGKITGYIGAFLYATSYYAIFNDREVVPTMPVILWTVWFLYSLHLLLSGQQKKGFLLAAFLVGLIWNLNFALVLVTPLIAISFYLSEKKIDPKSVSRSLIILLLTSLPLILFEIRHGFIQIKALVVALTTPQRDIFSGTEKFLRVVDLASKNAVSLMWGDIAGIAYFWEASILILVFIFLAVKKIFNRNWIIIFSLWLLIYIAFFSVYSKAVSEYYLNGMIIVWVAVLSVFLGYFYKNNKFSFLAVFFLTSFLIINTYRVLTIRVERNGYIYRKALVAGIKKDAEKNNYPCVSLSYITKPGYELGYRYFFYLEDMHVNRPDSGSPVYTIVYPLNDVLFPVHETFGALGLIHPDYGKYDANKVTISCSGENSNLTDPMFGFTK